LLCGGSWVHSGEAGVVAGEVGVEIDLEVEIPVETRVVVRVAEHGAEGREERCGVVIVDIAVVVGIAPSLEAHEGVCVRGMGEFHEEAVLGDAGVEGDEVNELVVAVGEAAKAPVGREGEGDDAGLALLEVDKPGRGANDIPGWPDERAGGDYVAERERLDLDINLDEVVEAVAVDFDRAVVVDARESEEAERGTDPPCTQT